MPARVRKPPVTIIGMRATRRIAAAYSRKYASRARVLRRTGIASSDAAFETEQPRLFVRAARDLEQVHAFAVQPRDDLQAFLVREAALTEVVRIQLHRHGKITAHGLRTARSVSSRKRARFASDPPQSSVRWFVTGDRNELIR